MRATRYLLEDGETCVLTEEPPVCKICGYSSPIKSYFKDGKCVQCHSKEQDAKSTGRDNNAWIWVNRKTFKL
jgi:hypothetical protein